MSLKSIRESYSKLLTTFNDAGIKLTENQKSDVDSFVLAIESSMSKQRESAIRKTKKAVEEKLEREFKAVFESIMKNVAQHNNLASKIQDMTNKLNESKSLSTKVDKYLTRCVESVLPKKMIVDYDKMQRLEAIQESLKDILVVDNDSVKAKKAQLDESFKTQKSKCETEVAKMQVKLNESKAEVESLKRELDKLEAVKLLESKTQNLPEFEARSVKKRLAEASTEEIKKNFKSVLESVKDQAKKVADEKETSLDEEINNIINDDDLEEDDMLKGRKHNLHVDESDEECPECGNNPCTCEDEDLEEDDLLKGRKHNAHIDEDDEDVDEEEEDFETMEEVQFDEDGNVDLDESEIIPPSLMKLWCNQSIEVR